LNSGFKIAIAAAILMVATTTISFNRQCLAHLAAKSQIAAEERQRPQAARQILLAWQSARQVRKWVAITAVHARPAGFDCAYSSGCAMNVEVSNGSKTDLSAVTIGVAFVPINNSVCPPSYAEQHTLEVKVPPGNTRRTTIFGIDKALSELRVCMKVIDFQIADK
jgi:hypothetical protein